MMSAPLDSVDSPIPDRFELWKQTMHPAWIPSLFLLLASAALAAWGFHAIPPDVLVPIRWNAQGEVVGYATRGFGLLTCPLTALALALLFATMPLLGGTRTRTNLARSATAWQVVGLATLALLVVVQYLVVATALGRRPDVATIIPACTGILLVLTGNFLGKTRPNRWMGIRTPWTLRNDIAWTKTHRAGARWFVAIGAVTVVLALAGQRVATLAFMVPSLIMVSVGLMIYSRSVCLEEEARAKAGSQTGSRPG